MLCFRFPTDEKTYTIDKQFLLGKSLLVSPVLEPGVDFVVGYIPEGIWYDFYTVSVFLYFILSSEYFLFIKLEYTDQP